MNHYPVSSPSELPLNHQNFTDSITITKCKLLPTKIISRGQFRGYSDIRRFQCYNSQCNLNFNEFQLCKYCSYVPYVPSPLRNQDYGNSMSNKNHNSMNNVNQYRCIKIDYIPTTRSNAIAKRNSNNKLIIPSTTPNSRMSNGNGNGNANMNGDLSSKFNEFWDHLESGKSQIKQRLMDIRNQRKLSFKKRSCSAPPTLAKPASSGSNNNTHTNNNNNENINYSSR
ncbi:hypothetical protein SBY92_002777 [Candida maltosa Xu316]